MPVRLFFSLNSPTLGNILLYWFLNPTKEKKVGRQSFTRRRKFLVTQPTWFNSTDWAAKQNCMIGRFFLSLVLFDFSELIKVDLVPRHSDPELFWSRAVAAYCSCGHKKPPTKRICTPTSLHFTTHIPRARSFPSHWVLSYFIWLTYLFNPCYRPAAGMKIPARLNRKARWPL